MSRIASVFWGSFALTTALWCWAAWPLPLTLSFFPLRNATLQITGVWSTAAMVGALLLILRPRWIEARLGGLDKMYRLHKWLGIAALATGVLHWLVSEVPKWANALGVGFGQPPRTPRPPPENIVEASFRAWRGLSETVGEWGFYAMAILIALALLRAFPYHLFRRTHWLLTPVFLALAFHSAVLLDFRAWATPFGVLFALGMAAAAVAGLIATFGGVGAGRKVQATVVSVNRFPALGVVAGTMSIREGWPGHKPGQFVFAMSNSSEGPHPYTIASAWDPGKGTIRLITKALGDHTRRVFDRLSVGTPVTLEGPYGGFTFDDDAPVQIWIGAGIGVTPFVARLEAIVAGRAAGRSMGPRVVMFHPTAEEDPEALALLRQDAEAAGIELHILVDRKDGRLTGERVRDAVPDWRQASLWFCGPERFGRTLREDFARQGFDVRRRFHQEMFEMR